MPTHSVVGISRVCIGGFKIVRGIQPYCALQHNRRKRWIATEPSDEYDPAAYQEVSMRFVLSLLSLCFVAEQVAAQHTHGTSPKSMAVLEEGLGSYHRPVSTRNAEAQKFFDQGMTLLYSFNHDAAIRAFERAA